MKGWVDQIAGHPWTSECGSGIDIVVNCAAAFVFGTVEAVTEQEWDRVLGVNVKGV